MPCKQHTLRVRTPKWLPIVDEVEALLKARGIPASTAELYDLWWDWQVEERKARRKGRGCRIASWTPSRRELGGWLRLDTRFLNVNMGYRNSGKRALWVCAEGDV